MAEKLISRQDAAEMLGVSTRTFSRIKAKLIARGLKSVKVGRYTKYLQSSLDNLILKAIRTGKDL